MGEGESPSPFFISFVSNKNKILEAVYFFLDGYLDNKLNMQ